MSMVIKQIYELTIRLISQYDQHLKDEEEKANKKILSVHVCVFFVLNC